jgi:hypothetical protein
LISVWNCKVEDPTPPRIWRRRVAAAAETDPVDSRSENQTLH